LIGKSVLRFLQDRASDEACKTYELPPHSSWGQVPAKRLIRFALSGEPWAYSEILALTEVKRAWLDAFGGFDGEDREQPLRIPHLVFLESDGQGGIREQDLLLFPDLRKTVEGERPAALLPNHEE
jgi:hypothetical protein